MSDFCTMSKLSFIPKYLNFRMNSLLNELKDQAQNQRKWIETLLRRSEQEQVNQTNQLLNAMKERLVRIVFPSQLTNKISAEL